MFIVVFIPGITDNKRSSQPASVSETEFFKLFSLEKGGLFLRSMTGISKVSECVKQL